MRKIKTQLETVNQQLKELAGLYRAEINGSGISENEFWIWYTLICMDGEYTQQDICNAWSLTKQTVNTIITKMVLKKQVVLESSGTRNRKLIRLTDGGKSFGQNLVASISSAEQSAFGRLSESDRDACINVLSKYIDFLREEFVGADNEK